MLIVVIDM